MHDGASACSLQRRAHRATQTCQSPLRAFQAASISSDLKDLWIWKSADNTSPHITVKPVTAQRWRGGVGGGVFLPSWAWISTAAGGRAVSQSDAVVATDSLAQGRRFFQPLNGLFPKVSTWHSKKYFNTNKHQVTLYNSVRVFPSTCSSSWLKRF